MILVARAMVYVPSATEKQQLDDNGTVLWFEYFSFLDCAHVRSATVSMDNAGSTKREHAVS